MSSQFCLPVLQTGDGTLVEFTRLTLGRDGDYSERDIQNLLFLRPELLPVTEIDNAFLDLIPVCMELPTSDGRLDVLYVTPLGRLAFVETKLWRNPEARREVVAQIIDYASELSTWSVSTLQDRVRQRTGRKLFDIVRQVAPQTDEAMFFDGLAECLEEGRFLLLVCGDGIRSGIEKMAEFLNRRSSLDFTFGLVEVAIYRSNVGDLYQARVLAKTERILREFQRLSGERARLVEIEADEHAPEVADQDRLKAQQDFWLGFWAEVSQALADRGASSSAFKAERRPRAACDLFTKAGYLLIYFDSTANSIGVAVSLDAGAGRDIYDALLDEREAIERECGGTLQFSLGQWALHSRGEPTLLEPQRTGSAGAGCLLVRRHHPAHGDGLPGPDRADRERLTTQLRRLPVLSAQRSTSGRDDPICLAAGAGRQPCPVILHPTRCPARSNGLVATT